MKPGAIVGGRYKILCPLAEGGFGRTFVAQDNHRPSIPQCVVKYLKPNDNNPRLIENAKRLFFEEAKTLERLGLYGQIPELLAYFAEKDDFFLVQEFIKGGTLSRELYPGQPWNEARICQLLFEVSTILLFVHSNGVIHRDIKPDNLIRRESDNKLVLVDFGAVKDVLARGQGSTTIVAGTSGYMPTEQGSGRPRYSSDIFALGVIGIQAATGLMPTAIQEDHQTGELIWSANQVISDDLVVILQKMVRYHFKDRYQSALEVLQDLSPLLSRYKIISPEQLLAILPHPSSAILSDVPISAEVKTSEVGETSKVISEELSSNDSNPSPTIISSHHELQELSEDNSTPLERGLSVSPTVISESPEICNMTSESFNASPTIISDSANFLQKDIQDISSSTPIEQGSEENISSSPQEQNLSVTIISESLSTLLESKSYETAVGPKLKERLADLSNSSFLRPTLHSLKQHRFLFGAGSLLLLLVGVFGFQNISQYFRYRQAKDNLEKIRSAKVSKQYNQCIQQANVFSKEFSDLETEAQTLKSDCQLGQAKLAQSAGNYTECIDYSTSIINADIKAYSDSDAQKVLGDCQLAQAQAFATERSFKKAIQTVRLISTEHPSFSQGRDLLDLWSLEIIKIAQNEYQQENEDALSKAKNIASAIPENTARYAEARSLIEQWEENWKLDEINFKAAKVAFESNDWNTAAEKGRQVKTSFWKKEVSSILQRAEANIAAAQRSRSTSTGLSVPSFQRTSSPSKTRSVRPSAAPRPQPRPSTVPTRPRELPRDRN